LIESYYELAVK